MAFAFAFVSVNRPQNVTINHPALMYFCRKCYYGSAFPRYLEGLSIISCTREVSVNTSPVRVANQEVEIELMTCYHGLRPQR